MLCLISMLHSMTPSLYLRYCWLLVWWKRDGVNCLWMPFSVFSFFCLHIPDWVQWVLCLISMIHPMTLLLCLQCCCLFAWREKEKSELLMDVFCVSSFFCLHDKDWVSWMLCLTSVIHPMTLLLCLQSCCLLKEEKYKEWIVDGYLLCVFFLLSSHSRLSAVSVVFNFNDSPNDVAPVSPM